MILLLFIKKNVTHLSENNNRTKKFIFIIQTYKTVYNNITLKVINF